MISGTHTGTVKKVTKFRAAFVQLDSGDTTIYVAPGRIKRAGLTNTLQKGDAVTVTCISDKEPPEGRCQEASKIARSKRPSTPIDAGRTKKRSGKQKRSQVMPAPNVGGVVIGTIVKLSENHDWGFMSVEGCKNLFFHITAFPTGTSTECLEKGQALRATVGEGPKGVAAVSVEFVEDDNLIVDFAERRRVASG